MSAWLVTVSISVVSIFIGFSAMVNWVNQIVPGPYMDEVFHVNQTQDYCQGRFEKWNPKITTPPGLYYASLMLLQPLMASMSSTVDADTMCSVPVLRSLNAFWLCLLYLISLLILRRLHHRSQQGVWRMEWTGFNLLLSPVLFFTSTLYYTDLGSLTTVALMYMLQLYKLHIFSGIAGVLACLFRQTNIVWVVFCMGLTVVDLARDFCRAMYPKRRTETLGQLLTTIFDAMAKRPMEGVQFVTSIFARSSGYIFTIFGFLIAVINNGGMALGDKSAHTVVFHLPQLYYCLSWFVGMSWPLVVSRGAVVDFLSSLRDRRRTLWIVLGLSGLISVGAFTYDHPYLLADNRHYTFYIWNRWFGRFFLARFLLVPAYLVTLYLAVRSLHQQDGIWRIGFLIATALVTIPNRLMEFRYFIVPYYFWRIHSNPEYSYSTTNGGSSDTTTTQSQERSRFGGSRSAALGFWPRVLIESVYLTALNAVTFYLFLFKPFIWPHTPNEIQRFMW